jgi:ATP-dependent Clp protease ATP-binding subunit ClpA
LGWDQAKKIYQSFLEPCQEGWLSDTSSESGPKVDCSKVVWILTSNWGQEKIIEFAEKPENEWVYKKVDEDDLAKIKRELIDKVLVPEVMEQFKEVDKDVQGVWPAHHR